MKHPGLLELFKTQATTRVGLMHLYRDWIFSELKKQPNLIDSNPELLTVAIKEFEGSFELVMCEDLEAGPNYFYKNHLDDHISINNLGFGRIEFHWDLFEERGMTQFDFEGNKKEIYYRKRMNLNKSEKESLIKNAFLEAKKILTGESDSDDSSKKMVS